MGRTLNLEPRTSNGGGLRNAGLGVLLTFVVIALAAAPVAAQCETGSAFAHLDVNKVRARLYNNGGLFWKGQGPLYNVPKETRGNAIFAHSIWIGGIVDGTLRVTGSNYGPWEFWPGPLDDEGNPPADCSEYDRMYSVSRADIEAYDDGKLPTTDLRDWPVHLGAPVLDGDGNPDNYNLRGGDRPDILGDQSVWWVMNDAGGSHAWSMTPPIGLEVRVTAYAFKHSGPLPLTTFYRYELVNRNPVPIDSAYFGAWFDVDLGDAGDDYVGSDSVLGLGFGWNGDDFDGGNDGYGDRPAAIGFDFVEGPIAEPDGVDNDLDGLVDEPAERLQMTSFMDHMKCCSGRGFPQKGLDAYRYMMGVWSDGDPMTRGGSGRDFSETPTRFMFPDHPPAFWSEENVDGRGSRNTPSDRRLLLSTGPFSIDPGGFQIVTYAIIFSQGNDRYESLAKLKEDDAYVQAAFDAGFRLPEPPDAPIVEFAELDGSLIVKWGNDPAGNNYLDSYETSDTFLEHSSVVDKTYSLEGYEVFRYVSESDSIGERIATFDVDNGVQRVFDVVEIDDQTGTEIVAMVAHGADSGLRHAMTVDGLTNYATYYFGVRAYAYSPNSGIHVLKSPVTRIAVQPSRPTARTGGTVVADSSLGTVLILENGSVTRETVGTGTVTAEIVDPLAVTGHTYRLEFVESATRRPGVSTDPPSTYSLIDEATGDVKFDGVAAEHTLGHPPPQRENVLLIDGLSISMDAPAPGPLDIDGSQAWAFIQVQGGEGVSPDACDPGAASRFGCDEVGGNWVYGSFNGAADWLMYHSGAGSEETIGLHAPNDFEIRATEEGSYGYFGFSGGNAIWVPFETWDIGPTGPFGVNDPSDDERMVPILFADGGGECFFGFGEGDDPFGLGWPITDRIYAYYAANGDYSAWEAAIKPLVDAHADGCPTSPETDGPAELIDFDLGRPLQRIIFMMDPTSPNYRDEFIPVGNVIRFLTTKPNLPGDRFFIHTAGFEPKTNDMQTAKDALDLIGIVPNPYKGVSDYELTTIRDVVRFTNLPDVATIRIYNLSGTLMRQLEKTPATTGLQWDLTNDDGFHIASGMYLVHVDVPGVGERVIKFGMVKKKR